MIPVMPNEGGFGEIDCSRSYRKQGPFLRRDNSRSFAAPGKGRSRVARRVKRIRSLEKPLLFARSLSLIGPAENPAALHLRLWSRQLPGFSLRRGWRRGRQILALHRIDQLPSSVRPIGAQLSTRAAAPLANGFVCAQAGDEIRRIASKSFFIIFSRKTGVVGLPH